MADGILFFFYLFIFVFIENVSIFFFFVNSLHMKFQRKLVDNSRESSAWRLKMFYTAIVIGASSIQTS